MTLLDGITSRSIGTPEGAVMIWERTGDSAQTPPEHIVVLVHGSIAPALTWQELMQDLPSDLRVIALALPSRSTHDDSSAIVVGAKSVAVALAELGIHAAHLVGDEHGATVVARVAEDHSALRETTIGGIAPAPALESPALFRRALLEAIGYIGRPVDPAPPTEAIILSSSD